METGAERLDACAAAAAGGAVARGSRHEARAERHRALAPRPPGLGRHLERTGTSSLNQLTYPTSASKPYRVLHVCNLRPLASLGQLGSKSVYCMITVSREYDHWKLELNSWLKTCCTINSDL